MPLNVHIHVDFNAELPVEQFDMVQQIIQAVQNVGANVGVSVAAAEKPAAVARGTRRARTTNGGGVSPTPAVADDVLGDPTTAQDESDEDLGLPVAQGLSPEESYERAMGYMRHAHNAEHKDIVNRVRKHFGVTKFPEIPMKQGPEFLRIAETECHKVGIHL